MSPLFAALTPVRQSVINTQIMLPSQEPCVPQNQIDKAIPVSGVLPIGVEGAKYRDLRSGSGKSPGYVKASPGSNSSPWARPAYRLFRSQAGRTESTKSAKRQTLFSCTHTSEDRPKQGKHREHHDIRRDDGGAHRCTGEYGDQDAEQRAENRQIKAFS